MSGDNMHDVILSEMMGITKSLSAERDRYRDALTQVSFLHFTFDVNEGLIRELHNPKGFMETLGLELPLPYDLLVKDYLDRYGMEFDDPEWNDYFSVAGLLSRYAAGERNAIIQYHLKANDTYYRRLVMMSKNQETGHVIATIVTNDITDQKHREIEDAKARYAAEDNAARANAAKSDFLANISRDVRTQMNSIIGMASIAERSLHEDIERVEGCLKQITSSSKQLLDLITDVIEMSKYESGLVALQEEPFNLPNLIEEIREEIKPLIEEKGHDMSISVSGIEHENVIGDVARLHQVCINLLTNAIKYTPDGGIVKLSVGEVLSQQPDMGRYEISIIDTGIGMSRDFMENVFMPFQRANDERMHNVLGTGLGLALSRSIIRMMGGDIEADSALDHGTRMIITLPLKLPIETQKEDEFISYNGKSCLVVEDNELNAEIAEEILSLTGLKVELCKNGEEALERMTKVPDGYYDIIFMDINMPVMNGYEASLAIRTLPREYLKTVPIVAMTANVFVEDVQAAKEAGMNGHISKPLDFDQIDKVLRRWLA